MYFDIVLFSDESKVGSALSTIRTAPEKTTINLYIRVQTYNRPIECQGDFTMAYAKYC